MSQSKAREFRPMDGPAVFRGANGEYFLDPARLDTRDWPLHTFARFNYAGTEYELWGWDKVRHVWWIGPTWKVDGRVETKPASKPHDPRADDTRSAA